MQKNHIRGILLFGPAYTKRARKSVDLALDAFEDHYGRLPTNVELSQLSRKLAWFSDHYQRPPTQDEAVQIVQRLEIH